MNNFTSSGLGWPYAVPPMTTGLKQTLLHLKGLLSKGLGTRSLKDLTASAFLLTLYTKMEGDVFILSRWCYVFFSDNVSWCHTSLSALPVGGQRSRGGGGGPEGPWSSW